MRRSAFDLGCGPFLAAFDEAVSYPERPRRVPRARLGGPRPEDLDDQHRFYHPVAAGGLVSLLRTADGVIGFDGNRFDLTRAMEYALREEGRVRAGFGGIGEDRDG